MNDLKLWIDTTDMVVLTGNIRLVKYDKRTHDFMITMKREGLHVDSTLDIHHTDFKWLNDLPIITLEIDNQIIIPNWKPNRYGQPADINKFQHVSITDETITISVRSNGTAEEIFNRYNPYEVPGNNEKVILNYHDEYRSVDEYQKHFATLHEMYKDNVNTEIFSHMFE